jgi:hypothetical protein
MIVMKDSQWAIAVGVLAALVFIIVFAGQYIGGLPGGPGKSPGEKQPGVSDRELTFLMKSAPESPDAPPIEVEQKGEGEVFFPFVNRNDQPVKVGLIRSSCRCTHLDLLLYPGQQPDLFSDPVATAYSYLPAGPLTAACALPMRHVGLAKATKTHEMKRDTEAVTVPAGGAGWVRMGWHAETAGPIKLDATLWMEDPNLGSRATLEVNTFVHEPFRVRPALSFGTAREADLAKGVRNELIVWSATRTYFDLNVQPGNVRGDGKSDPLEIGKKEALTHEERREMERRATEPIPGGVRWAWRVPLTLRAVAADGKTPVEIGPFRRTLLVSSPDFPAVEPKQVSVTARVRGVVDIGTDGEGGELSLGSFPRKVGKSEAVNLSSEVPGLELKVDEARTAKFVTATLDAPQKATATRQLWKLRLAIKPGAAAGRFPRKDDPLYEDSAVYLIGTAPGQTPRVVRIAVHGTATE